MIAEWTLLNQTQIPNDIGDYLVPGEQPHAAFATFRDAAVFTNKRLIFRDAQGMTGRKVETYSIPYSSILAWSTENAGRMLDFTAELQLWTKIGPFKINIGKNLDVRALDRLIAHAVLGAQ
ncbi:PH domain-containing protein [Corynebacterium tapiri]|uniref:PH domain-containing protein n=1 Tax=Corynebacterium tapiri TaxID=1448266 RepID=A0A5C4U5U2_9CORY|nr:PH domain-containing protein [Corynebacterium tapiri]TNL99759.1 PH domain-containing protein [Corynebacterium tapiri]